MLTCVVSGFLAGMLVIGVSFVSFWKSLTRRKSAAMTRTPEPYNENVVLRRMTSQHPATLLTRADEVIV